MSWITDRLNALFDNLLAVFVVSLSMYALAGLYWILSGLWALPWNGLVIIILLVASTVLMFIVFWKLRQHRRENSRSETVEPRTAFEAIDLLYALKLEGQTMLDSFTEHSPTQGDAEKWFKKVRRVVRHDALKGFVVPGDESRLNQYDESFINALMRDKAHLFDAANTWVCESNRNQTYTFIATRLKQLDQLIARIESVKHSAVTSI